MSSDDKETTATAEGGKSGQPAGTVERVLNFRDRNLLIGACREFCGKEGKNDYKAQKKLDRITKLLNLEETVEYFNMIDDSLEDELFRWQRERNNWLSWNQYNAGGLTDEQLKGRAPSVNASSPPVKPKKNQPTSTPAELRGPARSFYLPSKLDSWAQDVIRVVTWNPLSAEFVSELCEKFGVKDED